MTLLEIMIAMSILSIAIVICISFITSTTKSVIINQDQSFAMRKALSMMNELRAYADANEASGGASVLDTFDDGVGTSPKLTVESTVSSPDHILSGNRWVGSRWHYSRRITVRKFPSFEASNVRIVTVKIFLSDEGRADANLMADITSVITTMGDTDPTTQVYDIYLIGIENIPGWWVYLAYLTPFIENALTDMEARNPGMEFRRHWITKAAYGRDQEYKPYFNNAVDSNQDINYAYFYPGSMPSGSAVSQYYVPGNVRARVNIDGTTTNDYHATNNPYPYALADQYNHAMRHPAESALYQNRLAAGQETEGNLTYRLLLDDMVANPNNYRNAIFINLHGELVPMPSIRNYSDAAKDPAAYPQWRVVTHPEKIRYGLAEDMKLRVYSYLEDPSIAGNNFMTVPISVVIPEVDFTTAGDVTITTIKGGTDQDGVSGADMYESFTALTAPSGNMMYATVNYETIDATTALSGTVIRLYNSPLRSPDLGAYGLDSTHRLYGMDYIPSPITGTAFSQNLCSPMNAWSSLANAPGTVNGGGAMVYPGAGDYIYAFRGDDTDDTWRYSITANTWSTDNNHFAEAPGTVNSGGAMVCVGNDYIYAFRADATADFWAYRISQNRWNNAADRGDPTNPAVAIGVGGALAYPGAGDYIYAFQGGGSAKFQRYSISGNSWDDAAVNDPANTVGAGSAIVYTGGDYFYAFRGNGSTDFWRYSISGNSWTPMAVVQIGTMSYNIGAGGALVYPGSGDYIFAFQGNISMSFLCYSISLNRWFKLTDTPSPNTINWGGSLVAANGNIYSFRGNDQNTSWKCVPNVKNTARWIITVANAAIVREGDGNPFVADIYTRINDNFDQGRIWPVWDHPTNLSTTYIWCSDDANYVPFSERYQFQGDPRHCPYSDVVSAHRYNWYFDNLRNSTVNVISEWPCISSTLINGGGDSDDGWHGEGGTSGDRMEIDVPRYFQFLRTALTGANVVYTSITGWSYYYMGLGNEIGYDSANGFATSIPTSRKPFDGGTGTRNEMSITTDQTGGVKYIRENVTPYWWGMPWLGENYPDGVYVAQWTANGNLTSGSVANTFVRIRRRDITAANAKWLNRGTTFSGLDCVRRTQAYGCTSFFNIGTTTSTFRHQGRDGTSGTVTTAGQEMSNNYNFPLPASMQISRPFQLANNWGAAPTEFSISEYSGLRCTGTVNTRLYNHNDGVAWEGSSLIRLQSPATGTPNAFIVVNGIDRSVESGSAFIARYAVVSLVHSYFTCGLTGTPNRIVQLPRVEIREPNITTELDNPSTINITWSTEWKRWDGQKYLTAYADDFEETEGDLRYALLYSMDNGNTWLHVVDNSAATPGLPGTHGRTLWITDAVADGNETYTWDVADSGYFIEGSYMVMVEAYRVSQDRHYAFHKQKIFVNR
jgi:type II secretory pathway pseudopilin PulG